MTMFIDRPGSGGGFSPQESKLSTRSRLEIDIINSRFPQFLDNIVEFANNMANFTQPSSLSNAEICQITPEDPNDQSIKYLVIQSNLDAILAQDWEKAYASTSIIFKPGNLSNRLAPLITISGHNETFSGSLPKHFSFEPDHPDFKKTVDIHDAIIQALMVPHVNTPSSSPSPRQ